MVPANSERTAPGQNFVGAWLVSIRVGEPPDLLDRSSINPLAADALVSLLADGTLVASASPAYPVPNQAIQADRLLAGAGHGSWASHGEREARFRCAALLYTDSGNAVATLFIDASVQLGHDDTFSGAYTVQSHLSRGWTRNLPSLDGSVQGWRVETPATR